MKTWRMLIVLLAVIVLSACGGGGGSGGGTNGDGRGGGGSTNDPGTNNPGGGSNDPGTNNPGGGGSTQPTKIALDGLLMDLAGGAVSDGTSTYFVTLHAPYLLGSPLDFYLAKITGTTKDWEYPLAPGARSAFYDKCLTPVFAQGNLVTLCSKTAADDSNQIFIEKVNPANGNRTETLLANNWFLGKNIAYDTATGLLYFIYVNPVGAQFMVAMDLGGTQTHIAPRTNNNLDYQYIYPTTDGVYLVGRKLTNGSYDRTWVEKRSKDLQTVIWTKQYRPTDLANNDLDTVRNAILSLSGTLVITQTLDHFATLNHTGTTRYVIVEYGSDGTVLHDWDVTSLGINDTSIRNQAFDQSGYLYTGGANKINLQTGLRVWKSASATSGGNAAVALAGTTLYVADMNDTATSSFVLLFNTADGNSK